MSGKYALIIGNTEYADPGLAQLTAPGKDAEDFARVLKDPNLCAFDDVRVFLNQPSSSVIEQIDEFFDQRKVDDLLVLYFSGHGVRDELGSLYLAFKNTIRSRLRSTAIKSDYIKEAMDQSRSKRQVLILDCCNSGAFPQGVKAETGGVMGLVSAFQGYGRFVLTASDATQFAWEGNRIIGETQNSLFTHFLLKGLEEGEADLDGDGKITVDELYDYAYQQISSVTPNQTPTKASSKVEGDIFLRQITRIEDIKPISLPEELVEAIDDSRTFVREGAIQQLEKLLRGKNLGLARSAREALEKIEKEDDSRRVSQAALQALAPIRQAEQLVLQKAEEERLVAEKAEAERKALEEAEEDRKAKEEAKHLAALKATEERLAREKAEAESLANAKAKTEERGKKEVDRLLPEQKAEKERQENTKEVVDKEGKSIRPYLSRIGLGSILFLIIFLCGFAATKLIPSVFGNNSATKTIIASLTTAHISTQTPAIPTSTVTQIPSVIPATEGPTVIEGPTAVPPPSALPPSAACNKLPNAPAAPSAGKLGSADNPIVITFVPSGDTGKITKAGTAIADCLSQMTGLTFKIKVGTTFASSIEAMGAEKAQIGFLNTFSVLLAEQKYKVIPALVAIRKYATNDIDPDKALDGQLQPFYKGQFIANVSSGIKDFPDLKGKTFCFVDPNSTSGYIVPRIILKAHGINPDKDFSAVQNAGSHPNVAIAVYKGDCDAGVTFINVLTDASVNLQATYPDIADKVKVFAVTDRIPNDGMQFIKSLDPELQALIVEGMMAMAQDPGGKAVLKSLYNYDAFQEVEPTFYDDFANVLKAAGVDPATLVR